MSAGHKHRKGFSMKKKLVLSVMLVCLMALGLALIGCLIEIEDDEDEDDVTGVNATISLADLGNNTFTLTLTGATWKTPSANGITWENYFDEFFDWKNGDVDHTTKWTYTMNSTVLSVVVSRDETYSGKNPIKGTLTVKDNEHWSSYGGSSTNGAGFFVRIYSELS
jgi:hypothetical protein